MALCFVLFLSSNESNISNVLMVSVHCRHVYGAHDVGYQFVCAKNNHSLLLPKGQYLYFCC